MMRLKHAVHAIDDFLERKETWEAVRKWAEGCLTAVELQAALDEVLRDEMEAEIESSDE